MCGIVGYVGAREAAPDPAGRPGAARVPRLRLGRHRPGHLRGRSLRPQAGRQGGRPAGGPGGRRALLTRRPGPHPLGHARPPQRPQRPPPRRLHGRPDRHPQRHHRELHRAARGARVTRPHLRVGDRYGGHRASRRGGLPGRPGGCRARRPAARPGGLRPGRHPQGRAGPRRRRPHERAPHRRPRRGRGLPGLGRGGGAGPHAPRHLPRGGRRGRPRPRPRDHHRHGRPPPGAPRARGGLGHRGSREGRLRALHAQGDARAARGHPGRHHGPHPRPADPRPGAGTAWPDGWPPSTASSWWPAAARPTPPPWPARRCRPGRGCRRAGTSVPSSATTRRRSTSAPSSSP